MPNQIAPRMERRGNSGLNRLAEIVEPAMTVGSNLLAEIPAYASGMIEARDTGSPAAGVRRAEEVSEMLTYSPRTMEGQAGLQSLTNSVMRVMDAVGVDEAVNYVNNTIMPNLQRAFGERAASEIGSTLLMAIPMARKVPGIRAFHGSPHDFDKFSMDAIGTGEGAQAYGHGLYFADSEDVARYYRDSITPRDFDYENEVYARYKIAEASEDYGRMEMYENAMMGETPNEIRDRYSDYDEDYQLLADEVAAELEGLNPRLGHMYEVEIDASPDELLDWDVPLNEQSKGVRETMDDLLREATSDPDDLVVIGFDGEVIDRAADYSPEEWALMEKGYRKVGNKIITNLDAAKQKVGSGVGYYQELSDRMGGQSALSEALNEKGIKGIRYKDATSRGTGGGTSNYVIFDDRLINISKKYGIAIPAAAVLLGQETGQDPSSLYEEDFSA